MSGFSDSKPPRSSDDHRIDESAGEDLDPRNDPEQEWQEVFNRSLGGLRAFLRNRLSQPSDIDDCLQVVSVKMIEKGTDVAPAARRAWLFRVAANESARIWRRRAATERALERYAVEDSPHPSPADILSTAETHQQLQQAVDSLPSSLQQIVRLRIHDNLTFQQIADQLDIPLGTALTRMRRALQRLKEEIESKKS